MLHSLVIDIKIDS